MQGLWKEDISGWDRKGNKRKKTTRNHNIKDRALSIMKNFEENEDLTTNCRKRYKPEILTSSTIVEHTYTGSFYNTKTSYPEYVQIWKIRYFYGKENESVVCEAFLDGREWKMRDKQTVRNAHSISFKDDYDSFVEKIRPIEIFKPDWSKERTYNKKVTVSLSSDGTTMLWGKPLLDWKRWTLFNDGKRRKYAQQTAHRADRAITRAWITKGKWDTEMKTHALSKSILWEIY